MKKLLPLLLLLPTASYADITSSITSSIKLEVAAPGTTADRIGNSYSVSGTGVTTTDGTTAGSLGGLGAATNGVNAYTPITSLTTGEVSPFGDLTSTSGGTATNLAGTVDNHVITLTAGSAGTTATGSYVTSVTID